MRRVNLKLSEEIHAKLTEHCAKEGKVLQRLIELVLAEFVKKIEARDEKTSES